MWAALLELLAKIILGRMKEARVEAMMKELGWQIGRAEAVERHDARVDRIARDSAAGRLPTPEPDDDPYRRD